MKKISLAVFLCSLCLATVCAAMPQKTTDAIKATQIDVAEQFIQHLIRAEYKQAYLLFSPAVMEQYPYGLFETVQQQSNERLGAPVSFVFIKETGIDAKIAAAQKTASTSYLYTVTCKKGKTQQDVSMSIIFDSGESAAKLLGFRCLTDNKQRR